MGRQSAQEAADCEALLRNPEAPFDFGPSAPALSAEIFAQQILAGQLDLTCASVLQIADLLLCECPDLDDRFAVGKSVSAGLHQSGRGGLRKSSKSHPLSVQVVTRFISKVAPSFRFSSFVLIDGVESPVHKDVRNSVLPNLVIPLSSFQGGEVVVEFCDGSDSLSVQGQCVPAVALPVNCHPVLFSASRFFHAVRPAQGRRVVVAAYCLQSAHFLHQDLANQLYALGFCLPRSSDADNPPTPPCVVRLPESLQLALGPPLHGSASCVPEASVISRSPRSLFGCNSLSLQGPSSVPAPSSVHLPGGCASTGSSPRPSPQGSRNPPAPAPQLEPEVPALQLEPDIPPVAVTRPRLFLDLFSGARQPVSRAVASFSADRFEPVDIIHAESMDLLRDDTFSLLCDLADHGVVGAALAAPICGEFSILKLKPGGPPPVRTPRCLHGLPENDLDQSRRVQDSFLLHDRAREILSRVSAGHGLILFENPVTSMTFQDPVMLRWLASEAPFAAQVAACSFGLDWQKRWLFVSNRSESLSLACQCTHGRRAHQSLLGLRDASGQYVSRLSAEYPSGLATQIAQLVLPFLSRGGRVIAIQQWRSLLSPSPAWPLPQTRVEDGGGLRSTAAWLEPQGADVFGPLRKEWSKRLFRDKLCLRLTAALQGPPTSCPLTDEELEPFLGDLTSFLGVRPDETEELLSVSPGQPLRLFLLEALLLRLGDSEASMCADLRQGVRLGVNHALEPSEHWPPRDWEPVLPDLKLCEGSWLSASSHPEQVLSLLQEELAAGWIEEFSSLGEIQAKFPSVACGRLGLVLAEGRSPRLVVDSSISGVTEACFIPNRMLLPRIADVAACAPVHCVADDWVLVSLDIRKAHRLVLIHPDDQGLLCFSFAGRFFVSKTLNFGARASAFWWGRVAGALIRLSHALIFLPHCLWDYVDDFLGAFRGSTAPVQAGLWVILFLVLRVPISWAKCAWASKVRWIGWDISVSSWSVSLPDEKRTKLLMALDDVLAAPKVKVRVLESLIGRLLWVSGLWKALRPLLSPLYAALHCIPASCVAVSPRLWNALLNAVDEACVVQCEVGHASFPVGSRILRVANTAIHRPSDMHRMVFQHRRLWVTVRSNDHPLRVLPEPAKDALSAWRSVLESTPLIYSIRQPVQLALMAEADACASDQGCGLGGYVLWPSGRHDWFAVQLSASALRDLSPLFEGSPQSHIAALELLAQLVLIWLVDRTLPSCRTLVSVALRCDNAGAEAAAAKGLSAVRSLAAVLTAFLAYQCRLGVAAEVEHVPGFRNQLADELSRWSQGPSPLPLEARAVPPLDILLAGGFNSLQLAPREASWPSHFCKKLRGS